MSGGLLQRFVKADLCRIDGMIGRGHESERRILFRKILDKVRIGVDLRRLKTVLNFACARNRRRPPNQSQKARLCVFWSLKMSREFRSSSKPRWNAPNSS